MEGLSRESSFLSQGTIDAVMGGVTDLDMFLKTENLVLNADCSNPDAPFDLDHEQHLTDLPFSFDPLPPDSTQRPLVQCAVPVCTGPLPETADYPGPCDFSVEVNKSDSNKAKWEYSKSLNKLFAIMEGKIPFKFKWNQQESGLWIRILPIFLAQDDFSDAVRRCPTHVSKLVKSNLDFEHVDHIIRSEHPNSVYEENTLSQRLSIVVPLDQPQPGTDWSTVIFTFMCKNSCSLGMNRRSTALIFTLERSDGEIIGRRIMNIRICSCPRRDMLKEERDMNLKDMKILQECEENEERAMAKEAEENNPDQKKMYYFFTNKRPLKRLSKDVVDFQVRVPKSYVEHFAKILRQTVMMAEEHRELTPEEKITIKDCNKYIH